MHIYVILTALALIIALIGWRLRYLTVATTGTQVSTQAKASALLVIDMQVGIVKQTHYSQRETLITNIQQLIEEADQQMEIIFIKHSIDKHLLDTLLTAGQMQTGSPDTELIEAFAPFYNTIFQKHRADAFSSPNFEEYLLQQQIKDLYIVGADASACVYQTALGAVKRAYDVTILEDGLFATSQKQKAKMLASYKKHGIKVATHFD